ncbi:polysaccharide biosynthesis/export family protein [Candidatus Halocynthiibacter alkanivorans]|uniref:polysaccharide biosynthesis/export family protein n=1 Tax=Candidatus Halocynthiibacter alkanivorans TaxID=2267619 RepID=UPI00190F48E5|nr:polysaccharide biosynthesis/export family protein [Candidatus Halocynthiibacter alkanivorans]
MLNRIFAGLLLTTLAGCGAAYISPSVKDAGDNVQIVALTAASVQIANQSAYTPRALPAVFFQNAGGPTSGRGAGVAPVPVLEAQVRPQALNMRIPPAVEQTPYQIGVGDVVLLATKSGGSTVAELSGLLAAQNRRQGYTVQDDGAVSIPDVGRVQLAELTLEEAEALLFQRLVERQLDPTFSLEIAEFNSQSVSVGGAVNSPKVVPVTLIPLSLGQALAKVGGVDVADPQFASIRLYRDGTLYQIPLAQFRDRADLQNIRLIDGDSLFVDTEYELAKAQAYFQEQITIAQFRQQGRIQALNELNSEISLRRAALAEARSNYQARTALDAVARDYAYLTGEVSNPGRFALPFGRTATLADALYAEGGFSVKTGNPSQIYVLRAAGNGTAIGDITAWQLDASNAVNFLVATRMEMRPNDVVFVAEQPVTRWNRVVQQIVPSLLMSGVNAVSN